MGSTGNGGFGYQAFLDQQSAKAPKESGEGKKKDGKEAKEEDTYESRRAKAMAGDKDNEAAKAAEKKELARIQQELQNQRVANKKKEVIASGIKKSQENKKFEDQAYGERQAAEQKAQQERQQAEQKAYAEQKASDARAFAERQKNDD